MVKAVDKNRNINAFIELNRLKYSEEIIIRVCKYCGEYYVVPRRIGRPVEYCSDECRCNAREEQSRVKSIRWYHRNKHRMSEVERYGLGSGYLGGHRNDDFDKELGIVERELVRLKIK